MDNAEILEGLRLGQKTKVAINYGRELPTYYTMHVKDCSVVGGSKRLALIQNDQIPEGDS